MELENNFKAWLYKPYQIKVIKVMEHHFKMFKEYADTLSAEGFERWSDEKKVLFYKKYDDDPAFQKKT